MDAKPYIDKARRYWSSLLFGTKAKWTILAAGLVFGISLFQDEMSQGRSFGAWMALVVVAVVALVVGSVVQRVHWRMFAQFDMVKCVQCDTVTTRGAWIAKGSCPNCSSQLLPELTGERQKMSERL